MINKIKFTLIILIGFMLSACQKTNDLNELSDTFTLKREGAEMPVYVHGDASEKIFVLCLSGGPGDPGLNLRSAWGDIMEEKYAMVYWDQRGTGMAQGNLTRENMNLEVLQDDLLALVALLKHKFGEDIKLFLFGHSWGSVYGTSILVDKNNQNLFKGWISSSGGYDFCTLLADVNVAFTRVADEQITLGNDVDFWNDKLDLADEINLNSCRDFRLNGEAPEAQKLLISRGVTNGRLNSNIGSFLIVNNLLTSAINSSAVFEFLFEEDRFAYLDMKDQLSEIMLPTLVLHGKYDLHLAFETGQKYFDLLGSENKSFVPLERSGHSTFLSETELHTGEIINFIELYK